MLKKMLTINSKCSRMTPDHIDDSSSIRDKSTLLQRGVYNYTPTIEHLSNLNLK